MKNILFLYGTRVRAKHKFRYFVELLLVESGIEKLLEPQGIIETKNARYNFIIMDEYALRGQRFHKVFVDEMCTLSDEERTILQTCMIME